MDKKIKIPTLILLATLLCAFDLCIVCQHAVPHDRDRAEAADNATLVPGYSVVEIDPARIEMLGVTTEKVNIRDLKKTVRTVGIVQVDETRIAHVQTKFKGWIEELYVNFVGMPVKHNQPLFSVYSPELLATQEEFLVALDDVGRHVKGKFAQKYKENSVDLLEATRHRLELWDIPSEEIMRLEKDQLPSRTLVFRSPIEGIVLKSNAFIGMNVEPGLNTYSIADLSHVWVLTDIYEHDVSFIKMGQPAKITMLSFPDKTFKAKVTFIDYVTDTSTRTTKVRFELDNKEHHLKPGMYATTNIHLDMGKVLALPEEAVIDTGKRKIIFVDIGEGKFEPREVRLGFKAGPYYQVLQGVSEGESVITSAQFIFDSESRLKAIGKGKVKTLGVT